MVLRSRTRGLRKPLGRYFMDKYVGKTQSFLLHGRMTPFKVERHIKVNSLPEIGLPAEDYLIIKSLDLCHEARISTGMWNEQARRLELMRNEQSA